MFWTTKNVWTSQSPRPFGRGLLSGGVKYKPVNIQNFEKFSPLQTAIGAMTFDEFWSKNLDYI